jgi:thiol-disulfide isomerase/thioredoxin
MTLTYSKMLALETRAPDFSLPDAVSGKIIKLKNIHSNTATVVMFISNHCPYVKHIRTELIKLARDYQSKGIVFIAINSNNATEYPEDSFDKMREVAEFLDYPFVYLYDETQEVAKAYNAECTPDFYIFDGGLRCVYRGRLDAATPGNTIPVTGKDMRAALDAVLKGQPVHPDQHPSMGCNIKWR